MEIDSTEAKEKQLDKALKALDTDTKSEMDGMNVEQLERVIIDAQVGMATSRNERDSNTAYKAAKTVISDLAAGLRDVNKRQNAKITLALHLLEAKGKI